MSRRKVSLTTRFLSRFGTLKMTRCRWQVLAGLLLAVVTCGLPNGSQACTTAVISGRVTRDGRPILWKNRDFRSAPRNEVVLFDDGPYRVIGVVNAGSRSSVWMGVNEAGLCIENSLSSDLGSAEKATGLGNGGFMKRALQTCATVDEVRALLEETNVSGRSTKANFGVIDAHCGAVMIEAGPTSYTLFDANDVEVAPDGFLVRSNFAATAHDLPATPQPSQLSGIASSDRYLRACQLLDGQHSGTIDLEFVIQHMARDLADGSGAAITGSVNNPDGELPPQISTANTVSRSTTVSCAVFHGVRADEDPRLTTMWVILGDPKFSIAVPTWASLPMVADPLEGKRGGEIGEIARLLRGASLTRDGEGVATAGLPGIWEDLWPLERELLGQTRSARDRWAAEPFSVDELAAWHERCAAEAMAAMHVEMVEAKQAALTGRSTMHALPLRASQVNVAIYDHSDGSANGPKYLVRILTEEAGFATRRVRPEEIRDGVLNEVDVLIMPGGSGSGQAERLGETGRDAIRGFVDQGGGYVGICAGAYLASEHYSWSLGLLNARVWDRAHWARGTGDVTLHLEPNGQQLLGHPSDRVQVFYGQGPLLVPGNSPQLPAYEVLAVYKSEIARNGAPAAAMTDTHAIVRSVFGKGRVICFSPHPEKSAGPNHLMAAGVRWAARCPALKPAP